MVHFSGFYVSVYFAHFPASYLRTIRDVNVDSLTPDTIYLHHTRLYNLFNAMDRTEFIKEFVALLRFVAAGEANVGYLRRDSEVIHRTRDVEEDVQRPAQEVLSKMEENSWRVLNAHMYAA